MNSFQDITNRLSEKRKNCYLPSLDLVPGGKSTVRYVEVKLQALEEIIKGTLFHILDNVKTVLLALRRRDDQNTYTKAEEVRRRRRMKEQKRKNKTKKRKVLSRQAKELCKLLTGNEEIDITQKASIPVIDSNNLNREALHTKLRKRFHLEPLKQLIEQGYISDCVIIEIRQAIERLEADRTASRKKEDNQPKLTAFYMSSTCSNSKKTCQ